MRRRSLLLPLAALLAAPASGHTQLGAADSSRLQGPLGVGEVSVGLELEAGGHFARSDDDPAFTESLTHLGARPTFAFSPLPRLVLRFGAPVWRKTVTFTTEGYPPTATALSGLGDVEASVAYGLLLPAAGPGSAGHGLTLRLGSTLPTGNNDAQRDGLRLDEHVQLGTGAAAPGATAQYVLALPGGHLRAAVAGRVPLRNAVGYAYGPSVEGALGGGYAPARLISIGAALEARHAARDDHSGVLQANTGGFVLSAALELELSVTGAVTLFGSARVPLAARLNGEQRALPSALLGVAVQVDGPSR